MFHNIWKFISFVITEAFFHFHLLLEILFDSIPILFKWVSEDFWRRWNQE